MDSRHLNFIKLLIERGQVTKALTELLSATEGNSADYHDEVEDLTKRFKELNKRAQLGVVLPLEKKEVEKSIIKSLLEVTELMRVEEPTKLNSAIQVKAKQSTIVQAAIPKLSPDSQVRLLRRIKISSKKKEKHLLTKFNVTVSPRKPNKKPKIRVLEKLKEQNTPTRQREDLEDNVANAASYDAISQYREDLQQIRKERLRQAKLAFTTYRVLLVVGVSFFVVGIMLFIAGSNNPGYVSSTAGVLLKTVSLVLYNFYRQSNDRLDLINKDLAVLEKSELALRLVNNISNRGRRDQMIQEMVRNIQMI